MSCSPSEPPSNHLSGFVQVATLDALHESARHHITLRHRQTGEYHQVLLFTFPAAPDSGSETPRLYCMEATCPHAGAPLENAHVQPADRAEDSDVDQPELELADMEDMVVVCPWHEYDFNLRTGESSHGLSACTFQVKTYLTSDSSTTSTQIWIQAPKPHDAHATQDAAEWELIERRPVSESFSRQYAAVQSHLDPSAAAMDNQGKLNEPIHKPAALSTTSFAAEVAAIPRPESAPTTLVEWACLVLRARQPARKVAYTQQAVREFREGKIRTIGGGLPRARPSDARGPTYNAAAQVDDGQGPMPPMPSYDQDLKVHYDQVWEWRRPASQVPPHTPPREDTTRMVDPSHMGNRGKGGSIGSRIKMLHSLANIELWAIDLSWDIIARGHELAHKHAFAYYHPLEGGSKSPRLPNQFFADWAKVALDESKHASLLIERLDDLGVRFGQLPIHASLWESALETMHALTARISIIHLVHEARGLDVNPQTIAKFARAGDEASVEVLNVIHLDEVTHVAAGHRWLTWLCHYASAPQLDPIQVFRQQVRENYVGKLKGPFNAPDRAQAGLEKDWYNNLVGHKPPRPRPVC